MCALGLVTCRGSASSPDASPGLSPAPTSTSAAAVATSGIDEAALDAWVDFQRAVLALPALRHADGGAATPDEVLARARVEAGLLAAAGLTASQAEAIETAVGAFVTERALSGGAADESMAEALAALSVEQRARADQALALRPDASDAALAALEARFGADVVQTMLTRESKLTKTWEALLEAAARGDE